jgi:hypothetical protein
MRWRAMAVRSPGAGPGTGGFRSSPGQWQRGAGEAKFACIIASLFKNLWEKFVAVETMKVAVLCWLLVVRVAAFSLWGSSESAPAAKLNDAKVVNVPEVKVTPVNFDSHAGVDIHQKVDAKGLIDNRGNGVLSSMFSTEANLDAHSVNMCGDTAMTPDSLVSTGTYYQPFNFRQSKNLKDGDDNLLLMSHGVVQWFNLKTKKSDVLLAQSKERFRGAFVLDNLTLVVLATPNMRQNSEFVLVDTTVRKELRRVEADGCRDGHDVVRYGEMAYAVCTATGSINVYDVGTLKLRRRFAPYTRAEHINTIGKCSLLLWLSLFSLASSSPFSLASSPLSLATSSLSFVSSP